MVALGPNLALKSGLLSAAGVSSVMRANGLPRLEIQTSSPAFNNASTLGNEVRRSRMETVLMVKQICFTMRCRSSRFLHIPNCRAACNVFFISIAMVIGPTPPGTGVMAEVSGATSA